MTLAIPAVLAALTLSGSPSSVATTVGALRGQALQVSDETVTAMRSASTEHRAFHAAVFQFAPQALLAATADDAKLRAFAQAALFEANPDTRNWAASYKHYDAASQTLHAAPLGEGQVISTVLRFAEARPGARLDPTVDAALRATVASLVGQRRFRFYEAHWDNKDDTQFDGMLAVDETTGEVRVFVAHNFS